MEMKLTLAEARENGVKSGLIKIVADGYNAPVTAGERVYVSTGWLLPSMLCCPLRQLLLTCSCCLFEGIPQACWLQAAVNCISWLAPCVLGAGGQLNVRQVAAVQL